MMESFKMSMKDVEFVQEVQINSGASHDETFNELHTKSFNTSCCLWHGSGGVILKNRKISINYWFLRPYTHNLVKMQILQT